MSASTTAVASDAKFLLRQASREDLDHPGLLSQYFVSAVPGIGRDLEVAAMRSLLAARTAPGRTELFAEGFDGSAGCLIAEEKPWDSAMLGVAVTNLVILSNLPRGRSRCQIASRLLEHWLDTCPKDSRWLVTTRIPADDSAVLQALEHHGFHVLVPMVTLGRTLEEMEVSLPPGVAVSPVEPADIGRIEEITATAFLWGRFSADLRVPPEAAEKIHRTWVRNCCLGAHAKHVLVARRKDEVLGFIALKFQTAGGVEVGSIELIAASGKSRGAGIGRALVRAGCNWLSAKVNSAIVRTELPNIPALRMYEALGFRVLNGSLYLSRWQPAATAK